MKFSVKTHIHTHYESMIEAPNMTVALSIANEMLEKDIEKGRVCSFNDIRCTAQEYTEAAAEKRMQSMENHIPTGFMSRAEDGTLRYKDLIDGSEIEFDSDGNVVVAPVDE